MTISETRRDSSVNWSHLREAARAADLRLSQHCSNDRSGPVRAGSGTDGDESDHGSLPRPERGEQRGQVDSAGMPALLLPNAGVCRADDEVHLERTDGPSVCGRNRLDACGAFDAAERVDDREQLSDADIPHRLL